jgi:hypothetical protein
MTPLRHALAMLLLVICVLLAAGCISQPVAENHTGNTPMNVTAFTPSATPTSMPVVSLTISAIVTTISSTSSKNMTVSPTLQKSQQKNGTTFPQPISMHPAISMYPEYIVMDQSSYKAGEVIIFHIENKGSTDIECGYGPYRIIFLQPNGTWEILPCKDDRFYIAVMYSIPPGGRSRDYTIDTTDFIPGRYLLAPSCLNLSREFIIEERRK